MIQKRASTGTYNCTRHNYINYKSYHPVPWILPLNQIPESKSKEAFKHLTLSNTTLLWHQSNKRHVGDGGGGGGWLWVGILIWRCDLRTALYAQLNFLYGKTTSWCQIRFQEPQASQFPEIYQAVVCRVVSKHIYFIIRDIICTTPASSCLEEFPDSN